MRGEPMGRSSAPGWREESRFDRFDERVRDRRSPVNFDRDRDSRRGSPSYRPYTPPPRAVPAAPAPVAGPPIRLGFDNLGAPPLGLPPWKPDEKSGGKERRDRDGDRGQGPVNLEE